MNDVMIDTETLSTRADAVILSIGAVKFDIESGEIDEEGFYASISIQSNIDYQRRIDESTLIWWFQQSREAQQVFHEPKTPLNVALTELWEWLGHNKRCVWSNGADFDIPLLADAYSSMGMDPPWEFWNARCARTYMKQLPQAKLVERVKPKIAHNALFDAIAQAQTVIKIHALLQGKKVKA